MERNEINKCAGTVEEIKTSFLEKDIDQKRARQRIGPIYNNNNNNNNNNNSVKENRGKV